MLSGFFAAGTLTRPHTCLSAFLVHGGCRGGRRGAHLGFSSARILQCLLKRVAFVLIMALVINFLNKVVPRSHDSFTFISFTNIIYFLKIIFFFF
jgi:hypothetical protein